MAEDSVVLFIFVASQPNMRIDSLAKSMSINKKIHTDPKEQAPPTFSISDADVNAKRCSKLISYVGAIHMAITSALEVGSKEGHDIFFAK